MEISIDDSCIACGLCSSMCSDIFTVEDKAVVNIDNIEGNEECAKEASNSCPANAIIIKE